MHSFSYCLLFNWGGGQCSYHCQSLKRVVLLQIGKEACVFIYPQPAPQLHLLSDSYFSSSCSSSFRSWGMTGWALSQRMDWLPPQVHLTLNANIMTHSNHRSVCRDFLCLASAYIPILWAFVDKEDGQRWSPRSPPCNSAAEWSSTTERGAGHSGGTDRRQEVTWHEILLLSISNFNMNQNTLIMRQKVLSSNQAEAKQQTVLVQVRSGTCAHAISNWQLLTQSIHSMCRARRDRWGACKSHSSRGTFAGNFNCHTKQVNFFSVDVLCIVLKHITHYRNSSSD